MQRASLSRLDADAREVRAALRRRGLEWRGERNATRLLVAAGRRAGRDYALLGHYSYRIFLRDVLRHRAELRTPLLVRYVSPELAARYLRHLVTAGLIERVGRGCYRVRDPAVVSFGPTLEWYVAEILRREFGCAAVSGIRIPRARHGGDYDVLACAEGELLYVETKSAPPRQITQAEVAAFLDRVATVQPSVALFLEDTALRMRDKIVPMFAYEAVRRRLAWEAHHVAGEVWRVGPEVYVLNAGRDLCATLGVCLAEHFRARGITGLREPLPDSLPRSLSE
jgi:hypothetical protein